MMSGLFSWIANSHRLLSRGLAVALVVSISGCASLPAGHSPDDRDPWERYNRAVYEFNDKVDKAIIKPVAEAYRDYVPDLFQFLIRNFFGNLRDIATSVHHLAQGKPAEAGQSAARVLFNSTIGFLGLSDPATEMGFAKTSEDFGQTFGVWGAKPGPYFVIPLLGPSTVRDTVGLGFDLSLDPKDAVFSAGTDRTVATAVVAIDGRKELLQAEGTLDALAFDRYSSLRDTYLARRRSQVYDGDPPPLPEKN